MWARIGQASESQLVVDGDYASGASSKQDLRYLLAGANVLTLPTSVVQSVAGIDGAVVLRPTGELIEAGAICRDRQCPSSGRRSKSARTAPSALQIASQSDICRDIGRVGARGRAKSRLKRGIHTD